MYATRSRLVLQGAPGAQVVSQFEILGMSETLYSPQPSFIAHETANTPSIVAQMVKKSDAA
jgi:hypothetical protein